MMGTKRLDHKRTDASECDIPSHAQAKSDGSAVTLLRRRTPVSPGTRLAAELPATVATALVFIFL